jgi:haloalkane dehalogenase
MNAYRAPFPDRDSRLPTLIWPREIPIEGEPADVAEIVDSNGKWMAQSSIPKLLISGNPGAAISGRILEFCRSWKNQREVQVPGIHFLQEDAPHEIGAALADFVGQTRS